jgi:hypothetical protein
MQNVGAALVHNGRSFHVLVKRAATNVNAGRPYPLLQSSCNDLPELTILQSLRHSWPITKKLFSSQSWEQQAAAASEMNTYKAKEQRLGSMRAEVLLDQTGRALAPCDALETVHAHKCTAI